MRSLALLLLAAALVAAGLLLQGRIAPPAPPPPAAVQHLQFEGLDRTYRVFTPAGLRGPAPLVLLLHGYHDSAAAFERSTGFDAEAQRLGLLAVYPDGFQNSWNAGSICCGQARARALDDRGFLLALTDHLLATEPVDPGRVYVAGMSNGAMMSLRLACESPGRFAAVASVAGELEVTDCARATPISVLQVHGTADRTVLPPGLVAGSRPQVTVFQHWRAADSCTGLAAPSVEGADTIRVATGCAAGTGVVQVDVAGGDHAWPPGVSRRIADFLLSHHR